MSLPKQEDARSVGFYSSNAGTLECSDNFTRETSYPSSVIAQQGSRSPDDCATKKRRLSMQVVAVQSCLSSTDVKLTNVTVATIRDKRNAAKIAASLGALPSELSHLKRIKRDDVGSLQIILGASFEETSAFGVTSQLRTDNLEEIDCITRVKVPAIAPVTKAQLAEAAKYWPCNFHPNKEIEKLLSANAGFAADELDSIQSKIECVKSASEAADDRRPACLISNPVSSVVITCQVGYKRDEHPLKHCVVVALDALSEVQKGKFKEGNLVNSAISSNDVTSSEYLCTGFDIFLTNEPCIMCSMALLHSRARRVFFVENSPKVGALTSLIQLQFLKGINHRFQVFKITYG